MDHCAGPLIYYACCDGNALLYCVRCHFITATPTLLDAAHLFTDTVREGHLTP